MTRRKQQERGQGAVAAAILDQLAGASLAEEVTTEWKEAESQPWMYVGKAVRRGSTGLTAPRWSVAKQDEGQQQQGPEHAGSICHSKDWLYLSETRAFEEAEQQPHLA